MKKAWQELNHIFLSCQYIYHQDHELLECWIHISWGPWAFRMLRDLISLIISSCSNNTDESLELVFHRPGQIARPMSIGHALACKTFEVRPIFRALTIWLVKKREQIYKFLVKKIKQWKSYNRFQILSWNNIFMFTYLTKLIYLIKDWEIFN